ncbi:cytochrome c maturation protein CcmE [Fundidesulfovibrio butyratiphilus]
MAAKKKNSLVYLVALLLFLGGLGWLVRSGLSEGSTYFVNVGEALAMNSSDLTQVRLFGTVAEKGLVMAQGGLGARFALVDKDDPAKTMAVDYSGVVPDTFKPGVEVIVEGGFDPARGVFAANTLMTKCPSKYQKQNRG